MGVGVGGGSWRHPGGGGGGGGTTGKSYSNRRHPVGGGGGGGYLKVILEYEDMFYCTTGSKTSLTADPGVILGVYD